MKSSEFLLRAAEAIDAGFTQGAIDCRHERWRELLALTLPECRCYDRLAEEIIATRTLRFCLAAAVAESEGD